MAEAHLQQFLEKIRQLNAFVALSEAQPELRTALRNCSNHHEVVELAAGFGFDIGRRWGDGPTAERPPSPADQQNLLASPCPEDGQERSTVLFQSSQWRLECIHSCNASSPTDGWYDQRAMEWVLLLRGSARLQFEDEPQARDLCVGDALLIKPHRRHRVVATDPAPGTLWLALFWDADG